MLKKELCKKCRNKSMVKWTKWTEANWRMGYIYCSHKYREGGELIESKTTDRPPEDCPFILEQILK